MENGRSQTIGEAVTWCGRELAVEVLDKKVYDWFRHSGYRKKSTTANGGENGCAGAEGVEKGLWAALQAEGIKRGEAVVFADEMRLEMSRPVRRVWGR